MKSDKKLAKIIEDAVLSYDPYIGFDPGDTIKGTMELLKTRAGCFEIIEQLCAMLMDD